MAQSRELGQGHHLQGNREQQLVPANYRLAKVNNRYQSLKVR